MDIWVYDQNNGQVKSVTSGADARYPVWLGSGEISAEPLPTAEEVPGVITATEILIATPITITEPVTPETP